MLGSYWQSKGRQGEGNNYRQWSIDERRGKMDVLWIVNTNTFLLVFLVIMVSYLTVQVNMVIRWLKRE